MDSASFKDLIYSLRYTLDVRDDGGESQALMVPFDGVPDGKLDCSWLRWATVEWSDPIVPRGILIMQDWGLQGESLSDAICLIEDFSKNPRSGDPTLSSLFASEAWRTAIRNRSILVTNAVWGLRPSTKDAPNKMCGYLGAAIHKRAFLRWGKLVALLSSGARQDDDFRLFVAGEWARFDGKENRSGTLIKDYLSHWRQWASNYSGKIPVHDFPPELDSDTIGRCTGQVVFLSHPCTWNYRFELDPLAGLDPNPAG